MTMSLADENRKKNIIRLPFCAHIDSQIFYHHTNSYGTITEILNVSETFLIHTLLLVSSGCELDSLLSNTCDILITCSSLRGWSSVLAAKNKHDAAIN